MSNSLKLWAVVVSSLFTLPVLGAQFRCAEAGWTPVSFTLTSPQPSESAPKIRIDICWNETSDRDEDAYVAAVTWKQAMQSEFFIGGKEFNHGVKAAMFGDTSQLTLAFADEHGNVERLKLTGIPETPSDASLNLSPGGNQSEAITMTGAFEMGDPFQSEDCMADEIKDQKIYTLETATLKATRCVRETGSGTDLIRLIAIEYQDNSELLTPEQRQPLVIKGADLDQKALYSTTHHNCNDSIELHLNFVDWTVQFDVLQRHIQLEAHYGKNPAHIKMIPWHDIPSNCNIPPQTASNGQTHKPLIHASGPNPYRALIDGIITPFDSATVAVTYSVRGQQFSRTFWIYRTYTMVDKTSLGHEISGEAVQVTDAQLLEAILDALKRSPSSTKKIAMSNLEYQLSR